MSDTREEAVTGQHRALVREDVLSMLVRLETRVEVLERHTRDAIEHHRERDRGVRQLWLWALGLLVTLTVTVVGGLIVWNGQITRLEERVEAMRAQVQALVTQVQAMQPSRWSQP